MLLFCYYVRLLVRFLVIRYKFEILRLLHDTTMYMNNKSQFCLFLVFKCIYYGGSAASHLASVPSTINRASLPRGGLFAVPSPSCSVLADYREIANLLRLWPTLCLSLRIQPLRLRRCWRIPLSRVPLVRRSPRHPRRLLVRCRCRAGHRSLRPSFQRHCHRSCWLCLRWLPRCFLRVWRTLGWPPHSYRRRCRLFRLQTRPLFVPQPRRPWFIPGPPPRRRSPVRFLLPGPVPVRWLVAGPSVAFPSFANMVVATGRFLRFRWPSSGGSVPWYRVFRPRVGLVAGVRVQALCRWAGHPAGLAQVDRGRALGRLRRAVAVAGGSRQPPGARLFGDC